MYFITVRVDDVIPGTLIQVQHFKEVMPMWVLYGKMTVRIENFCLELTSHFVVRRERRQRIDWKLLLILHSVRKDGQFCQNLQIRIQGNFRYGKFPVSVFFGLRVKLLHLGDNAELRRL